jgi:hypothetical protein
LREVSRCNRTRGSDDPFPRHAEERRGGFWKVANHEVQ